jgi:hypothetical protein
MTRSPHLATCPFQRVVAALQDPNRTYRWQQASHCRHPTSLGLRTRRAQRQRRLQQSNPTPHRRPKCQQVNPTPWLHLWLKR